MKPLTEEEMLWMFEIVSKGDASMKKYKVSFFNVETQRDELEIVSARSVREAVHLLEFAHFSRGTIVQVFKVEERKNLK